MAQTPAHEHTKGTKTWLATELLTFKRVCPEIRAPGHTVDPCARPHGMPHRNPHRAGTVDGDSDTVQITKAQVKGGGYPIHFAVVVPDWRVKLHPDPCA